MGATATSLGETVEAEKAGSRLKTTHHQCYVFSSCILKRTRWDKQQYPPVGTLQVQLHKETKQPKKSMKEQPVPPAEGAEEPAGASEDDSCPTRGIHPREETGSLPQDLSLR